MASNKFTPLIIIIFVTIMGVASIAHAQLGGLGGLVGNLLGLIRINGTVFCSIDGNMGVNGTATPIFPNALVQLQCGGNIVSSSTTNAAGVFSMVLDPLQQLLPTLLSNNCNIVVKTPLSTCNASLPSVGGLLANLQFIGNTLMGLLNITNLIPSAFKFLPTLN